jgi:type II secretion system protein C
VPEIRSLPATDQPVALAQRSWADREPILTRNLFGAQIVAPPPEPEPEPDLEETKLPLELLGTLLAADRSNSQAVISERGTPEPTLLREGEPLERYPQAKIARIERKRVILKNGSKHEELLLSEKVAAKNPRAARTASRRSSRRSVTRQARTPAQPKASSITDQLRQIQVAGLTGETAQQLLTQARITPIFESGEMAGMEVRDITPGSLYEKIGLSEGDVIQSFNGIKLDNEGAGANVLAQLGEAEHFELVLSDGTVKSMSSNEMVELMEGSKDAKSEVE